MPGFPIAQWGARAWQYRDLIRNLIRKDFRVRYQGSFLGFLWTLVTPLVMLLIYLVAFKFVIRIQLENFALFLVTGILPWTFFQTAVISSTEAIVGNAVLLKNIYFPRETLPVANVLFHFSHFILALVVFVPIMVLLDAPFSLAFLGLPLLLGINLTLVVGLGLFLAAATVFFVDIRQLTDLGLMALFWLTPIVYHIDMVPLGLRRVLLLGPMAAIVNGYQDIIYFGQWPSLDTWAVGGGWALGALLMGLLFFRWVQPQFAEAL